MNNLKIVLVTTGVLFGTALFAQQNPKSIPQISKDDKSVELNLTAAQKEKIAEVQKEMDIERKRIKEDKSLENGKRGPLIKALHIKERDRINEIINSKGLK